MFSASYFINLLLSLPGILVAISFHEMAHGYAADAMGDPTPKLAGRLTVNPLKHIDPIGFISMLLFRFGWAKPVPVNPNNFKNHRKGIIVVSLAGCFTNLLLGFISLIAIYAVSPFANVYLLQILQYLYLYNLMFAVFNLIPIPPLDGSQILAEFLPYNAKQKFYQFSRYGMIILQLLVVFNVFGLIITPIINGIDGLFRMILNPLFLMLWS